MYQRIITPNETLQLNELLAIKSLSLTKSLLMSPLTVDPDLKAMLKKESDLCEIHVRELLSFMEQAEVSNKQDTIMEIEQEE